MAMTREQAVEALRARAQSDGTVDARDFLAREEDRLDRFSAEAVGLYFDFSKHPVSGASLTELLGLAQGCGMEAAIAAMMRGEAVNVTEDRAAQHVALRGGGQDTARIAQADAVRGAAYAFAERVRSGQIRAAGGQAFTDILHIGIGGSDLGPRLVQAALGEAGDAIGIRFLSSVDPEAFASATAGLDPATTLVFVVSKSFKTPETKENFARARAWLSAALGKTAGQHLVAATANPEAARQAGIADDRLFEMWDWVGGRYSLWSTVSLSVIVALGPARFDALLSGARAMDRHFETAPLAGNAPVLSALLTFWHQIVRGAASWAVVPYALRLRLLVSWLQQLSMESLGKGAGLDGRPLDGPSGPVVWGGEGPDGQHAFFQLLHQGDGRSPVDILAFRRTREGDRQDALLANAVAQAEALLRGRDADTVRDILAEQGMAPAEVERQIPHRTMPGGRASTFILGDRLDASALGAILAFYEHQTYALSVLMGLNAFDQFGVELGKQLAAALEAELGGGAPGTHDASTRDLLRRISGATRKQGDQGA